MKLCPACDRHLFGPEPTCPFCGAAQATTSARACGGALAAITLAMTLGSVACGPIVDPDQGESSSGSVDDATSGPPTTLSTTGATTVEPTTVEPTTDDGPVMTTLETTSSDSDATDDAPCAFYACPPDSGPSPLECDPFAQDCPPGEKCNPWANDGGNSWNATRCTPIDANPDAPGEPCTVEGSGVSGIDSCELGAMCFWVDPDTNEGTCVPMCTGSPDVPQCEAPEQACAIANDGVITLCFDTCDPLAPACDAGEGCYPWDDGFICLQDAETPGTQGQPCNFVSGCDPGLVCLDASRVPDCAGVGCCTEYCDTAAGLPCPGADQGVMCIPWYEPDAAPPGLETVGVCALPPP